MEIQHIKTASRIGAFTTLIGSVFMLGGAALLVMSGADMDAALDTGEISNYLEAANNNSKMLITNLSIWICGVILIGAGATMMTMLSGRRPVIARIAMYNYWIAVPMVVISYVAWLTVVARLSPDSYSSSVAIAEVVGWFATRADWIATILILGTGPVIISISGKTYWVPKWLYIWSYVALFTGFLTAMSLFVGGITTYGFLIIPVGMGWMVAVSIVLFRINPESQV